MGAALRGLAANLLSGARTALLLPVARTSFRIDAAQLLLLAVLSALIDVGTDWLRLGPDVALDGRTRSWTATRTRSRGSRSSTRRPARWAKG